MINSKNKDQIKPTFKCPIYVPDYRKEKHLINSVNHFIKLINFYEDREKITIDYSGFLISDLIRAFSRDVKKLIKVDSVITPSQFRISGLIAFWIRKLKPLQKIVKFNGNQNEEEMNFLHLYLNEQFALDIGLSFIDLSEFSPDVKSFRREIYRESSDILTNLRYRAISPQAMAQFFKIIVQLRGSRKETIDKLVIALEYRDDDTGSHVKRISEISYLLAEASGLLSPEDVQNIKLIAPMHDIGKINIPDKVLHKKKPLSKDDWDIIKQHPTCGSKILSITPSSSTSLKMAHNVALYHHEKWDGSGYPNKLKEEAIPIEARIVALADAFDAMRRDRVYRKALSEEKALEEIRNNSGIQFDPKLCKVFLKIQKQICELYK